MLHTQAIFKNTLKTFYSIAFLTSIYEFISVSKLQAETPAVVQTSIPSQELQPQEPLENQEDQDEDELEEQKIIKNIFIEGTSPLLENAVRIKIPYKQGEVFNPGKTAQLIRNVASLGYFTDIQVQAEDISDTEINLYIHVKEDKQKLSQVKYEGSKVLKADDIEKQLKLSSLKTINQEEAEVYAEKLKRMLAEKSYHNATVTTELQPAENNTVTAVYTITEGPKAAIKQICFEGNRAFPSKKLKSLLLTQEDWLLSFLNKAGTYIPDMLEQDKQVLEHFYQSNGFLTARVADVRVITDPCTQFITITFVIEEGDLYTVKCVSAPGNDMLSETQLLSALPVRPGQLYSRELIRQALEMLRVAWGQFGYIYADVSPVIQPNFEDKTVDITFYSDLGSQMYANRINIIGNCKTRDYVIRRNIAVNEGELITTEQLDFSKAHVESLGFFDPRDGVNWRITKVSENLVDLDLMLKEVKTGKLFGQVGYGGGADPKSPTTSLRVGAGITDRNFLGTGIVYNLNLSFSRQDRNAIFSVFQPWIFDRPLGIGFDVFHRTTLYEDVRSLQRPPVEQLSGGNIRLAFTPESLRRTNFNIVAGIDRIRFNTTENEVCSQNVLSQQQRDVEEFIYNRRFQSGNLNSIGLSITRDLRNNPVAANRGYIVDFASKVAVPYGSPFGFAKADIDATWLTPLIGEYDLTFVLHGHAGYVKQLQGKVVPYRELYNVGGQSSVRGFTFGQISPQLNGDSIGGSKAFWVNAELIFPITKDQTVRGVLFYDGGAGWDTPLTATARAANLPIVNNRFNYRHSIGFGIRLSYPVPLRVDWGFKLDRNKRRNETAYEVDFTMSQEF
jgi:outer membrane protein insertion porin family